MILINIYLISNIAYLYIYLMIFHLVDIVNEICLNFNKKEIVVIQFINKNFYNTCFEKIGIKKFTNNGLCYRKLDSLFVRDDIKNKFLRKIYCINCLCNKKCSWLWVPLTPLRVGWSERSMFH